MHDLDDGAVFGVKRLIVLRVAPQEPVRLQGQGALDRLLVQQHEFCVVIAHELVEQVALVVKLSPLELDQFVHVVEVIPMLPALLGLDAGQGRLPYQLQRLGDADETRVARQGSPYFLPIHSLPVADRRPIERLGKGLADKHAARDKSPFQAVLSAPTP